MPFQPGILFSVLLLFLCLGINMGTYPTVHAMLDGGKSQVCLSDDQAAFDIQDDVPLKSKTTNINRPIPIEKEADSSTVAPKPEKPLPKKHSEKSVLPEPSNDTPMESHRGRTAKDSVQSDVSEEKNSSTKTDKKKEAIEAFPSAPAADRKQGSTSQATKEASKQDPASSSKSTVDPFIAFAPLMPASEKKGMEAGATVKSLPVLKDNVVKTETPQPSYAKKSGIDSGDGMPKKKLQALRPTPKVKPLPPGDTIDSVLSRPVLYDVPKTVVSPTASASFKKLPDVAE